MPSGLHLPKLIAKAATNNAKKEELTVTTKLVTQMQIKLHYMSPETIMANARTYDTQTKTFLYRGQYVSWIAGDTITNLCAERPNDYAAVEWVE